ncbi:adenylate/guanylate cyclase domain-containing protein [Candidatus Neptunochlamydia vexilliferae]|nr:adenylate/guanylate cyclase domain-containing protein [Candidatus Neptunochlamydia vexilliferae]
MSTLLALFIIYGEASRLIFQEIRSTVLSLTTISEELIHPQAVEDYIKSQGDSEREALKQELLRIQSDSHRSDIYAEHVYLIKKDASGAYYYLFGDRYSLGTPYSSGEVIPAEITVPFVTSHIHSNEWGSWLSGYAPIRGEDGKVMALLGLDVRTKEIYVELERLFFYGLIAFAISILVAAAFAYFLSKLVSSSLGTLCDTVQAIGNGDFSCRSHLHTQDEFNELSMAINTMAKGLEERERLKSGFARYVSQYALDELLKLDQPITLKGERRKVTLLFSDIRHFTSMAEELPPEEVLKMLNEYFEEMIEVVFSYGGTLDKFIGDGMMVEFGAPMDDKLQELHAVLAAIQMQLRLEELSANWEKEGRRSLEMGIGIHTGLAVLGNIGSEKRMEYTAIGDAVNVASRLERYTKKADKSIIVSKSVYDKVEKHFVFEPLKEIEISGRRESIEAYALDPHQQKDLRQLELIIEQHRLPED